MTILLIMLVEILIATYFISILQPNSLWDRFFYFFRGLRMYSKEDYRVRIHKTDIKTIRFGRIKITKDFRLKEGFNGYDLYMNNTRNKFVFKFKIFSFMIYFLEHKQPCYHSKESVINGVHVIHDFSSMCPGNFYPIYLLSADERCVGLIT